MRWKVSALIKDQLLSAGAVNWLLEHQDESPHIENRLILYPRYRECVAEWARRKYVAGEHHDRRHRFIAQFVKTEIPKEAAPEDSSVLVWAIYHAHIPDGRKINLIVEVLKPESVESVIKVAHYLRSPRLVRAAIRRLSNAS